MKRLFTFEALFLCSLLTFAQFSGSGSGTENDPYLIMNPIQLNQLRNYLNQENVYFKLMADIDLREFLEDENPSRGWQSVGTSSAPFKGVLDGNGHTVSGLWIDRNNSDYVGFFGCTNGATIKNLTLGCNSVKGKTYVGVLSAHSTSTSVNECSLSGSITGASYVGGCIGWGESNTITSVSSTIDVTSNGDYAGGLIGYSEGWDCTIAGNRIECNSINGGDYIGGICGSYRMDYGSYFHDNYVQTSIFGNNYVGGICGEYLCNSSGDACICAFVGTIKAHSQVGGIFGYSASNSFSSVLTIKSCYAICNIVAGGDNVGGLIGTTNYYKSNPYAYGVSLSNSYSNGTVIGNNNIGGVIGYTRCGSVMKCYSHMDVTGYKCIGGLFGKIEGYSNSGKLIVNSNVLMATYLKATEGNVGRIFGEKGNYVTIGEMGTSNENKAYNRAIVINAGVAQDVTDDEQNGTGVSATTLKLKATYVAMGWDLNETWAIQETECYPYMQKQTAPPVITSQLVSGATTISGKCIDGGTITLEIDGVKKQLVSSNNAFSFTVDPLQAGHEVRVSAKAEGKEQSYYTTEVVSFLGKGTEADPYQIYTAADLSQVYRKGYYKLMNDIDLTSYINQYSPTEGWESIGREGSETIHFDGNGHKITGLWCNSTRDNTGLFSCFANGYIKNLTVETANGKQVKGGNYTGIIIGKLINGEMTNCKVVGSLADGTPVGGLMGKLDGGKVSRCQADVTINVSGENSYIGGLIGEQNGEVDQCLSYGTLTATGKTSYVGGLVGISNSGSSISNSYSSAITNSSLSAAGIVAYNYGVVDKCYAIGNVYSKNYGAGVVGYNDGEGAVVKNCVAMNNKIDVTFESQSAQSGGYGQRIIGGIKNNALAPEMNNYALKTMQVSVNNVPQKVYDDIMNGTAKTAAQLKSKATYEELGWDFNTIWKIEEESSYPYQAEMLDVTDPEDPNNPDNPEEPEIIDVTDITDYPDAIYAEAITSHSGGEVSLTISLKNAQAATAYSFDLQLPEGVSLATNSNGSYQYTLSSRHNGHSEVVNYNSGSGLYSFAVLSIQSKEVNGNDGVIWAVKLKISDKLVDGVYSIKIKNAKYSLISGSSKVSMPEVISKLTIESYIKGDVNNDGDVDIADAVCIVNHVVGIAAPSFVAQAADVNGDGDADIADAVCIVNYVVGIIQSFSDINNPPTKKGGRNVSTDAITAEDISLFAGKEGELTISLKNSQTTNAYSFDFVLPEGVEIVKNEKGEYQYELSNRQNGHSSVLNYLGNNKYSFAILSLQSKTITGNDGAICTFKIKVDEAADGGKYAVTIKNAKYSLPSGASKVPLSDTEGQLTVKILGDANSDGELSKDDVNAIANHIMGDTPKNFDEEAADMNCDKLVNAVDIVKLVDLLGK